MGQPRFGSDDFALLAELGAPGSPADGDLARRAEEAWERARQLLRQAADAAGEPALVLDVWPWRQQEALFPFVWGRWKRRGQERFAAHVGIFLAPDGCNCALDLEKDPLDAGTAGEALEQVHAFFRADRRRALGGLEDDDLRVWMDDANVRAVEPFLLTDYDRFVADNRDDGHPWPKVGYRFAAAELVERGDRQVAWLGARIGHLLPLYDALLASYGEPR